MATPFYTALASPRSMSMIEVRGQIVPAAREFFTSKTAVDVWSSVATTVLGFMLLLALVETDMRADPVVAIGLVGLYGVYSQRQEIVSFFFFVLQLSFVFDLLWLCLAGPLNLTGEQIAALLSSGCWRETGSGMCYVDGLLANASFSSLGSGLASSLAGVLVVVKVVVLLLLPELRAALAQRHGSVENQLAGLAKGPVGQARAATFVGKALLLFGGLLCVLRGGRDTSLLVALLSITTAVERCRELKRTTVPPARVELAIP